MNFAVDNVYRRASCQLLDQLVEFLIHELISEKRLDGGLRSVLTVRGLAVLRLARLSMTTSILSETDAEFGVSGK